MAKVWKVPNTANVQVSLPKPAPKPYSPNNTFYSLYKKTGKLGCYTRVSIFAYTNPRIADNVFRNSIQSNPLEYSIRLVKESDITLNQANLRYGSAR